MFITKKIAFIGGDARIIFAAEEFAENGFEAAVFGFDAFRAHTGKIKNEESCEKAVSGADFIVLPPLVSRDGENVYAPLSKKKIPLHSVIFGDATVFCGGACPDIEGKTENYASKESFALQNAVPTAEGALKIAMEETGETICGMRACVLGFGRIAVLLTKALLALGARVDVFARRSEARALAKAFGANAYAFDAMASEINSYDCIFNTVPERIVGADALAKIKKDTPFIELASSPGGADEALARSLGVKFVPAGGLPGKIMPKTAGKIIYETIKEMIREGESV